MQRNGLVGVAAMAAAISTLVFSYTADAQDKAKPKSKCNAIAEEAACKADATCVWIAALIDSKTKKQKRKAYCKTRTVPKKANTAPKEPAKK